ncbi:MAG: hypothetical protein ACLP7Q_25550 [Isosphaeraceae bacterium]
MADGQPGPDDGQPRIGTTPDALPEGTSSLVQQADQQPAFVLLSDGRIVSGVLTEEDGVLIVQQRVGTMKFPKKRVEKVFDSIEQVYRYKIEQLPENDFGERINLARWCLGQKMEPEARCQLEAILQSNPKHSQARSMLDSLNQAQTRQANRMRDPDVRQTGGEQVVQAPAPSDRPGALDASVISGARRGMGITDLPVIFDLPPAQAVKRADEFARYVHPVLQTYCARCHNERYDGTFQLIQVKTKQDRTRDTLRANLDATIKLVDREYPPRSELLASCLRPHGLGPNSRPIFQGSNDRAYQILATWVNKLHAPPPSNGVVPAKLAAPPQGADEENAFASQRSRIVPAPDSSAMKTKPFPTGPVTVKELPPVRVIPGQGVVPDSSADPNEFPAPFAISGQGPPRQAAPKPPIAPTITKSVDKARSPIHPDTATEASLASAVADTADAEKTLATDPALTKPRKPLTLDPTILQRALQLRNQNRDPGLTTTPPQSP